MGRRKLVRKEWLEQWIEGGKTVKPDLVRDSHHEQLSAKFNEHDTASDG